MGVEGRTFCEFVCEDVSDGKSSRPWAMHGKPAGRPAGPSIEYFPIAAIPSSPIPSLKNRSLVDFQRRNGH